MRPKACRARTRASSKTAVFVTHDVREALSLGTRVALMHAGRIVLLAAPREFVRTTEPHARAYLDTLRLGDDLLDADAGQIANDSPTTNGVGVNADGAGPREPSR